MSKRGRHTRAWHLRRLREEWSEEPDEVIRELFDLNVPLTVMAGICGVSYPEMHEWVRDLGLTRSRIARLPYTPVQDRLRREWGFDPAALICADRAAGMKLSKLQKKYRCSNGFINCCLHARAPHLVGTRDEPISVAPPNVSPAERARRAEACRGHNRDLRRRRRGWFADYTFLRVTS